MVALDFCTGKVTVDVGAYNDIREEVVVGIDDVTFVVYGKEEDEPHCFENSNTD